MLKKWTALILACMLAAGCVPASAEEESVRTNQVLQALETARKAAEPYAEAAGRLEAASESERSKAAERAAAMAAAINGAKGDFTYVLEGDTDFSSAYLPIFGNLRNTCTIDLNGYCLHAPQLTYGIFVLRNGTVTDAMAENDGGALTLTIEADCALLATDSPVGLDLANAGDMNLVNHGLINGLRKMLYQSARSGKMYIVNDGTIYSDGYAISVRAFHQNLSINLINQGTVAGLVRGLDIHCAGGAVNIEGPGTFLGTAGADLEIPRITFSSHLITDDMNLEADMLKRIQERLDPYGDKDVPTGIALDMTVSQPTYWSTWKVTGEIWASRAVMRMSLPLNAQNKGSIQPAIASDSPSRLLLCSTTLTGARMELNGADVERNLTEFFKILNTDGFFAGGGEMQTEAYSRYSGEDGRVRVFFSSGDTCWSRITGTRTGKEYTWNTAENGTVAARAATEATNSWYQLKAAMNLAGPGGIVVMDQDASIPEGEGAITVPQGLTVESDGKHLGGVLRFIIDKNACMNGVDLSGETLQVSGTYKTGDVLEFRNCRLGTVRAENLVLQGDATSSADNLILTMKGGVHEDTLHARRLLQADVSQKLRGDYLFRMREEPEGENETDIKVFLGKNSFGKTLTFEGETNAATIRVAVLSDKNPETVITCNDGNPEQFYHSYLYMLRCSGLKGKGGKTPTVSMVDETGNVMYEFETDLDGKWRLVYPQVRDE